MPAIQVNEAYELYQIIKDFGDPLEIFREAFQNAFDEGATEVFCKVHQKRQINGDELIIDIWNNGSGLEREKAACFFDLANSSKVDQDLQPTQGKLGYKGHGSKIFFNSERVIITSRTPKDEWSITLDSPLDQIQKKGTVEYSDFLKPTETDAQLPADWSQGFFLRIVGHHHFRTKHTFFKLNHENLRDYCKWFTVFGTVRSITDPNFDHDCTLALHSVGLQEFERKFGPQGTIDPDPEFQDTDGARYELISLGHYFPPERTKDRDMKSYAQQVGANKAFYEYYSHCAVNETVTCTDGTTFDLVIWLEGYQTKRRYDTLLTGRGKSRTNISHSDSERFGLWACKGGVPVEKIDHWIEGGKGTYTFMHGFVDCEAFELTANRGSIHNSDIEVIDIIRQKLNEIFAGKIKNEIAARDEIENLEKQLDSIEESGRKLKERYNQAQKKKTIVLPDGTHLKEPTKRRSGYSESETLVLLVQIMTLYPRLFTFELMDYDTTSGIDFVTEFQASPKYIELKGTLHKSINHPFRHIYKFICYEIGFGQNEKVTDIEDFICSLTVSKNDKFQSSDANFKGKTFTSYRLDPTTSSIPNMEVIELKSLLTDIIGASAARTRIVLYTTGRIGMLLSCQFTHRFNSKLKMSQSSKPKSKDAMLRYGGTSVA